MKKILIFFTLILVNTSLAGCLIKKPKTADTTPPASETVTPDESPTADTDANSETDQDRDQDTDTDSDTGSNSNPNSTSYSSPDSESTPAYDSPSPLIPRGKPTTITQENETILSIIDFAFSSQVLTVDAGTKVTWINTDNSPHSLMSKENLFLSAVMMQGDSFSYIYPEPGIYNYYCGIHTDMVGTILVK